MPSHPDRIRPNYCEHFVARIESNIGIFQICLKCGKRIDVYKVAEKPGEA